MSGAKQNLSTKGGQVVLLRSMNFCEVSEMQFYERKNEVKPPPEADREAVSKLGNFISETKNYHLRTLQLGKITSTFASVLPIVFYLFRYRKFHERTESEITWGGMREN